MNLKWQQWQTANTESMWDSGSEREREIEREYVAEFYEFAFARRR